MYLCNAEIFDASIHREVDRAMNEDLSLRAYSRVGRVGEGRRQGRVEDPVQLVHVGARACL